MYWRPPKPPPIIFFLGWRNHWLKKNKMYNKIKSVDSKAFTLYKTTMGSASDFKEYLIYTMPHHLWSLSLYLTCWLRNSWCEPSFFQHLSSALVAAEKPWEQISHYLLRSGCSDLNPAKVKVRAFGFFFLLLMLMKFFLSCAESDSDLVVNLLRLCSPTKTSSAVPLPLWTQCCEQAA